MIPSYGGGTLWEIRWLKEHGELGNVVGICPPKLLKNERWFQAQWEKARQHLAPDGVAIPAFAGKGFLVEWSASGKIVSRQEFGFRRKPWKLIREIFRRHTASFIGTEVPTKKLSVTAACACAVLAIV